jgi:cell division transport system permease protein
LNAWIRHQRQALWSALRRLAAQPLATLLATLAIGVAISLPGGLYLILDNLGRLAGNLPTQPEISLFLDDGLKAAERDDLARRLKRHPGVLDARFVAKDAALKSLAESQDLGDLVAGLPRNPLPDAWVVRPRATEREALTALEAELAKFPGVSEAQLDSAWAERLHAALDIGRTAVLLLAGLFAVALVAITGNAIRALILARRDEIQISRLIGATDRYIRRPFLYLGALQALLGGLAAIAVLALAGSLLGAPVSRLAALYGSSYQLHPPALTEVALVLAATTLLGWIGAWLTVARTLRQVEAAP